MYPTMVLTPGAARDQAAGALRRPGALLLIPPGSALLDRPAIQPFLGPLDQAAFTYRWTHPDPRMDLLHQAVSAAVAEAARAGEDPAVTFDRVRALAYATHGAQAPARRSPPPRLGTSRPPRLSEPWFC